MPLAGTSLLPRKVAALMYDQGWNNIDNLTKMLATADAESNLYDHAWHWNDPADPNVPDYSKGSTDWGYLQLNDGNKGGKKPVVDANGLPQPSAGGSKSLAEVKAFAAMACDPEQATAHARAMYVDRGFQPWVAYTSGRWQDSDHIKRAVVGVGNFLREKYGVPLT